MLGLPAFCNIFITNNINMSLIKIFFELLWKHITYLDPFVPRNNYHHKYITYIVPFHAMCNASWRRSLTNKCISSLDFDTCGQTSLYKTNEKWRTSWRADRNKLIILGYIIKYSFCMLVTCGKNEIRIFKRYTHTNTCTMKRWCVCVCILTQKKMTHR